jgi:hypothetical protein
MVDAIEQSKKRQWIITNYVLVLYAAVFGYCETVAKYGKTIHWIEREFAEIVVVFISLVGMWNIIDTHGTQYSYRNYIRYIRRFSWELRSLLRLNEREYFSFNYYFCQITLIQIVIVIISTAIVLRYLLKDQDICLALSIILFITLCLVSLAFLFYYKIKQEREKNGQDFLDRR